MHHIAKRKNSPKGLVIALIVTALIMLLEFIGGIVTNSLALLSDSGHMLSDVSSLFFSLLAMWAGTKPPSDSKHFGYHRLEVLAALLNGVTLLGIAITILYEAYQRVVTPQPVQSQYMIAIAVIGLVANLISAWALMKECDVKNNINARSAYLHVIGDAISSIGVIIAGLLIWKYSIYIADPAISGIVALVITKGAISVIRQSVHILMEGKPDFVDTKLVKSELYDIDGVIDIHDFRLWSITSGLNSFSCHLIVQGNTDSQRVLAEAEDLMKTRFGIEYVTIQIENA
jgi:cobalt-zinc-cadmium efflux system protein